LISAERAVGSQYSFEYGCFFCGKKGNSMALTQYINQREFEKFSQDPTYGTAVKVTQVGAGAGLEYNATTPTETDGGTDTLQGDVNGNLKTVLATGIVSTVDSISAKIATDAIMNNNTELTPKFVCISAASSGNNTLLAAVTGKKIRVLSVAMSFSGTVNAKFQSGASGTDISKLFYGVANTQVVLPFNPVGWFETASATLLNLNISAATAVDVTLTYVEV
jgi:hypothetical protein